MKRILSLALVLVMLLGVMPMATADTVTCDGTNHTYQLSGQGTEKTAATCHSAGVEILKCTGTLATGGLCSAEMESPLPVLPHTPDEEAWETVTEPTCIAKGLKSTTCAVEECGTTITEEIDMVSHTYGDDGVCTTDGCNASRDATISAAAVSVTVGGTAQITVSSDVPYTSVTFNANSSPYVTVSETGVVTGVKKGSAVVQVTVTGPFTTETVECTVTVTDGVAVSVDGILNIPYDSSASVTATLAGKVTGWNYSETVSYAVTSGSDVISVNASTGAVTVKSTGLATITSTISYVGTDNAPATVTGTTSVSVYKDDVRVDVEMEDGYSAFLFGNVNAIEGNTSVAQYINRANWAGNSAHVQFGTVSNSDAYLTMPAGSSLTGKWCVAGSLENVQFTVIDDTADSFATSFIICSSATSSDSLIYAKGVLTIEIGEGGEDIVYNTTNGKTVTFDEDDFDDYWDACGMSGYPEYVIFEGQPYYGDLYTTTAMKTKVDGNDKFYYGATASQLDLDAVTYDPYSFSAAYEDTISFAMYGDEANEVIYGTVLIKVGEKMNFTDVKTTDYFYDAVVWAVGEGITSGTSATTFSPNATCTRAQVVTFLYRAAGEPDVSGSLPFTDVKYTDYYYDAVLWAYKNDITTGLTATTFGPNATVTRGQVVTFLCRALDGKASSSYNPFTDVKSSDYYYDAVLWAVKNDVTTGLTATTFGPNSGRTRGQIVTFLYRAYEGE